MAVDVGTREQYFGDKQQQLREGYGVYNYENKFFQYEGEWKGGKKHGHGKFNMRDGSYYEGEFQNGEIEGHGFRYYATTGNTYSGQFHMGELHGDGVMKYSDGAVYEGEWHRNKRQGYGSLRMSDNSLYQGYLYNNKRHGEGTQIYSNGDTYEGDWVKDKRQGHGELRYQDGTIYEGQWMNDVFNGQGVITHSSGFVYEGLWINGKPDKMASRLSIKSESPLEVLQGTHFSLEIECFTEDGEFVEDQGRELQISAGFRHAVPKFDVPKSRDSSQTGLFDMIEDMEEKPISTPFGYDIVNYPLTDLIPVDDQAADLGRRSKTALSSTTIGENEELILDNVEHTTEGGDSNESATSGRSRGGQDTAKKDKHSTDGSSADSKSEKSHARDSSSGVDGSTTDGSFQPLPYDITHSASVTNQRTEGGRVTFQNLVLPAAPPMYRPFMVQEEEERLKRNRSRTRDSKDDSRPSTQSKKDRASVGDDSRPSTQPKREKSHFGDERFARPGEYVIMVKDQTTPPFLDIQLEPAFLIVKILLPKKPRKVSSKKDKGPKWNTMQHITEEVTRSQAEFAIRELSESDIVLT